LSIRTGGEDTESIEEEAGDITINYDFTVENVDVVEIERFLELLLQRGGKFKLIWFMDLSALYAKDTVLNFLRSFVAAYLIQGKWKEDIEEFSSPADPRWLQYIRELTPSFLMIGVENVSKNVAEKRELNFKELLASIALQAVCSSIPVVYLNGLVANLCSLYSHRIEPHMVDFIGWEDYLRTLWSSLTHKAVRSVDLSSRKSIAHLWAHIIGDCKMRFVFDFKFFIQLKGRGHQFCM
uniref:E3 ubiquitin-protein ligase listerin n=1 Tax=Gongylonema pulchrum TaxID=637853 RepID=A0A183EBN2_9BILA